MLPRWLLRSKTALLAVVMLSGGGALPVLDVLLYHGRAATHFGSPHFETSSTAHSHGDGCRLGSIPPYSPEAAPLDLGLEVVAVCFRANAALPATAPRLNELNLLPQPRAPPSLPA